MKKTGFTVEVKVGNNLYSRSYNVVAGSAEVAIRKAKAEACKDTGRRQGWRCTSLTECDNWVIL